MINGLKDTLNFVLDKKLRTLIPYMLFITVIQKQNTSS